MNWFGKIMMIAINFVLASMVRLAIYIVTGKDYKTLGKIIVLLFFILAIVSIRHEEKQSS